MNFLNALLDNEKLIILTLAIALVLSLALGQVELTTQIATGMIGFYSGTKLASPNSKL